MNYNQGLKVQKILIQRQIISNGVK